MLCSCVPRHSGPFHGLGSGSGPVWSGPFREIGRPIIWVIQKYGKFKISVAIPK